MTQDQQLALINDLRQAASHSAYNRYSAIGQVGGVAIAITGSAVLSVLLPVAMVGTVAGVTTGVLIYGLSIAHTRNEMQRCINGGVDEIKAYLSPENIQTICAVHADAEKKPLAQEAPNTNTKTQTSNGTETAQATTSQSPERLPVAPVALQADAPHLLLWGRTRAGKTNTARYLLGNATVHYITVKATDTAPVEWDAYRLDPRMLNEQIAWLLDTWESIFYSRLDGDTEGADWFLMDELITVKSQLKKRLAERLENFIKQVITAGAAVNAYLGILTQSSNASELGIAADLLKNCAIVGCTGQKKTNLGMAQSFAKYAGYRLTPEQLDQVKSLTGYWQMWDNNGPCLSQIPYAETDTKELELCPISDVDEPGKTQTLHSRIIDYLQKQNEARKVREIRSACKRASDDLSTLTDDIKSVLSYLVTEQLVMEEHHSQTTKYFWIGTGEG